MTDLVRDEAALWMARARDPRFADWDALTEWLEADPARNLAYEEAFAGHDLAGMAAPAVSTAPVVEAGTRWRRHRWVGGVLAGAAAAAALIAFVAPYKSASADIVAETAPGQHRLIHLADGTRIALNGDSRLVLNRSNARTARLERGEALFSVVHDETRPFTVDVNGARMVDLGTRFDVVLHARGSEVAVAEGAVLYDPNGAAVRLGPGRLLRRAAGSQIVEINQIDPAMVGTWQAGHLIYRDASLSRVADDLARATGEKIIVDHAVADRPFTGAIALGRRDRDALARRLGAVLDVAVAQDRDGLYLKARARR